MNRANRFYQNKLKINKNNVIVYERIVKSYILVLAFLITKFLCHITAFADTKDEKPLTYLFKTEAFRGSWKVFEKYNWLGGILNFIISSICFVSMFCMAVSVLLTVCYFAMRPFWDNVHEVKQENISSGVGITTWWGIDKYAKGAFFSNKTSGLDSLLNLVFIFVPDIYMKSEMNKDHRDKSLNDDDGIVTWFIKTGWKKVFIMFILSMGFNGSLMQCFGMVVDGLGVVGNRVASYKMDTLVENVLNSGDNYNFTLGDSGRADDKLKGNIAKEVYKLTLGCIGEENQSTTMKQTVGKNIENRIRSEVTKNSMTELLIANGQPSNLTLSDDDWNYINYNVIENTDSKGDKGSIVISVSDLIGQGSFKTSRYIHITPVLSRRAPAHDYLQVDK